MKVWKFLQITQIRPSCWIGSVPKIECWTIIDPYLCKSSTSWELIVERKSSHNIRRERRVKKCHFNFIYMDLQRRLFAGIYGKFHIVGKTASINYSSLILLRAGKWFIMYRAVDKYENIYITIFSDSEGKIEEFVADLLYFWQNWKFHAYYFVRKWTASTMSCRVSWQGNRVNYNYCYRYRRSHECKYLRLRSDCF